MRTRLDLQIEELQHIVETRLALCQADRHGLRCILPVNHQPAQEHRFTIGSSAVGETSTCHIKHRGASSAG